MGTNDMQQVKQQTRLATTNSVINVIEQFSKARALELDDYQKLCGVNALNYVGNLVEDISTDLERDNVISVVQNLMYLRLNVANGEVALITRNSQKGKKLEMQVMGFGYDALLRNFGLNVRKVHKAWLVREKDEYIPSEYIGLKATEPIWRRAKGSETERGKVVRIVYPVEMTDGYVEYLEGERESVKISLIAQAKQNMMKAKDKDQAEKLLRELENHTLDELVESPEWRDKTITCKVWDNGKWGESEVKIFNDTYTGASRENMIERKMRNHAIRKYPRNLDNIYIREAFESTYEEERYNNKLVENIEEKTVGKLDDEVKEKANQIVVEVKPNKAQVILEEEPQKQVIIQQEVKVATPKPQPKEVVVENAIDEDLENFFE